MARARVARQISGLILAACAAGYAIAAQGGDGPVDSNVVLAILSLAAIVIAAFPFRSDRPTRLELIAVVAAALFPVYVLLQLVPLPLFLLRVLDPTRAEIADALRAVMPALRFAPVSIVPDQTLGMLSRMAGYVLVFLVVRESACRFKKSLWGPAIPLILFGGLEAALGLAQHSGSAEGISGTYPSKDHFAGLLEMVLPLALMYGLAIVYTGREMGVFATSSVIKASILFVMAMGIFVAIVFSLSKLAFIAALGSLFTMGAVGWAGRLTGAKKWAGAGVLLVVVVLTFLFLPPQELVNRFAGLVSDETAAGRAPIAHDTLHLIAAFPLFGSGLGTYQPGLLRYQTSVLDFSVLNAHNDYLQLLSELGIVGFLILAVLIGAVSIRAGRVAILDTDRELRLLALGCVGGLAGMLVHSLGDFNMYVPANAIVLAWIAGMAASLPESGRELENKPAVRGGLPFLRIFVFSLGGLLLVYAGAWLIFLHWYESDAQAERQFCHFGICDSNTVRVALASRHDGDLAAAAPTEIHRLLLGDPAGPYNWEDLGDSLQRAGRTAEARASFARALELGPHIPFMLIRAARFHFDLKEDKQAVELMTHALEGNPAFAQMVFSAYDERNIGMEKILRHGLPANPTVWRSYLNHQTEQNRFADAMTVWQWLVPRGYADEKTANEFSGFLLSKKQPEAAVGAWALYAGSSSEGYPDAERVFNGDFESDPLPQPAFDWWIDTTQGAVIDFDSEVRHAGARSMRIQFDETQNLTYTGLRQTVVLKGGRYRFSAWVRAKDLSTNEGVAFSMAALDGPGPNFTTDAVLGSSDWKLVERDFVAPPGTSLVWIRLTRKPSLKFDSLLKGTLWMDQVSIRPEQ